MGKMRGRTWLLVTVMLIASAVILPLPLTDAARNSNANSNVNSNVGSNIYSNAGNNRYFGPSSRTSARPVSDEQRLLWYLMVDYEKAVRPVHNATDLVTVSLGLTLAQIADLDERNQVLTTIVWLDQKWVDQKMKWNRSEFGGLTKLRLPCHMLWLPDIVLYNSVDDHTKGYMQSLAMIEWTGEVFWPPIVKMRSSCKIDIRWFPFDAQVCSLKLGSWAYDGYQVDVSNSSDVVDTRNSIENGEWDVIRTKVVRNVKRYPCCSEPFPDITFYLHLQRRHLYYTMNIIIPCMMMSFLTMMTFALPAESGEKITLGLTVMLSFSVFMLLIAETMPPTSESAPLAGVYLTVIMGMSGASIIMSVLVLNIFVRGRDVHRPPRLLKAFCHYLAHVLLYKMQGRAFSWTKGHAHFANEHTRWFPGPSHGHGLKADDIPLIVVNRSAQPQANSQAQTQAQTQFCRSFSTECLQPNQTAQQDPVLTNGYANLDPDDPEVPHEPNNNSDTLYASPNGKHRLRGVPGLADSNLSLEKSDSSDTTPTCRWPRRKRKRCASTSRSRSRSRNNAASVARRLAAQKSVHVPAPAPVPAQAQAQAQVQQVQVQVRTPDVRNHESLLQLVELLRASNQTRKATVYHGNLLDLEASNNRYHVFLADEAKKAGATLENALAACPAFEQPCGGVGGMACECSKEEIDRCLSTLLEQQRYLELREQCTFEWQQIAVIFDRFFLVTFILTNIIVSLFMLVINPMTRNFDGETLLYSVMEKDQRELIRNNEQAAKALEAGPQR